MDTSLKGDKFKRLGYWHVEVIKSWFSFKHVIILEFFCILMFYFYLTVVEYSKLRVRLAQNLEDKRLRQVCETKSAICA